MNTDFRMSLSGIFLTIEEDKPAADGDVLFEYNDNNGGEEDASVPEFIGPLDSPPKFEFELHFLCC